MTQSVVATPPKKAKRVKKVEREIILVRDGRHVSSCNLCPKLCDSRTQIVNGYGPRHARIAVIGEAPGEIEDSRGRPFIGPAGVTVRNWLTKVGLNPERDVYFDNAVKCRPEGNKTPTPREIANCNEHLWAALEDIKPDIIVAAGNTAIQALLPESVAAEGITKVRGHIFWNERLQRKIIPMFHPSAVLHDFGLEIFCLTDLRKAVKESKKPTDKAEGLGDYAPLLTVEDVERECLRMEASNVVVYNIETAHSATLTCEQAGDRGALDWMTAQIMCIGLTDQAGKAWSIPIVGQNFREVWLQKDYPRVIRAIKHLLETQDGPAYITQNGKFDIHHLHNLGINARTDFDTMIAHTFIHESASHALEPLSSMYTAMPYYSAELHEQTDSESHMERADDDVLLAFVAAQVDCTFRVAVELDLLLDEEDKGARWVFENVSMPLQEAVRHIEERGVLIDMVLADQIIEQTDDLIRDTEVEFFSLIPPAFHGMNYGSWQQKQNLLYRELKLPLPPILTKTGSSCVTCRDRKNQHIQHTSTDKDALKELLGAHPAVEALRTLTQLHTLKKTFLLGEEGKSSGMLHQVRDDGRIHTQYNVAVAETGRLSSSGPNLQNIPNDQDDRPAVYGLIRKLFIAPPGRKLVEIDYSQLELRVLAYMANEKEMIKKFEANEDFHLFVARHLLWPEIDPDLTDAEWRSKHKDRRTRAKTTNFGIPYGLTAFGLAQRLGVTENAAIDIINTVLSYFVNVRDYFRLSDRDLKRRHKRKNKFGRTRHFFGVDTMTHFRGYNRVLQHMKREAYNYPIQSTGSDILSLATIIVDNDVWFVEHDAFMVLSVHDSIMMECPEEFAEECGRRVLTHFEAVGREHLDWYVPGEAKCGQRWSQWEWTLEPNSEHEYILKVA